MRTVIFTTRQTTLTIDVSKDQVVDLVQMGQPGQEIPIARLSPGATNVAVQAGVFKVVSQAAVKVTAEAPDVQIVATLSNKGDWPDLRESVLAQGSDPRAVAMFLAGAKSVTIE